MQTEELRLDGNAAAGVLREVFARDMTAAVVLCAQCHALGPVGTLLDYGGAMGVILRCPACQSVMLRLVRMPGGLRFDASGISLWKVPEPAT